MSDFLNNDDIGFESLSLIVKKGWAIRYEKKSTKTLHSSTSCVDSSFSFGQLAEKENRPYELGSVITHPSILTHTFPE